MRHDHILIRTPAKDAGPVLVGYFSALAKLSYPRELISLGFLESDSRDDTYELLTQQAARLAGLYWKRDFGVRIPPLVSTDYPFHRPGAAAVDQFFDAIPDPCDRSKIASGNAKALFRLAWPDAPSR